MKKLLFILFVFSVIQYVNAQSSNIDFYNFKKQKDKLISVGFSTSEVKAKLGNPKSISGGFPEDASDIIFEMPKMVGQLNNSTWFYSYKPFEIEQKIDKPDSIYIVNGIITDERTYKTYISKNEVFYVDGKLVAYDIGIGYKLTSSSSLKIKTLDKTNTKVTPQEIKYKISKYTVVPIYCVIFDKGTQVVAETIAYFLCKEN